MTHQDEFEFGDSKAETTLRRIMLTRSWKTQRFIREFLQNVSVGAKSVKTKDEKHNEWMYLVLRNWFESRIDENHIVEDKEIITYFRNSVIIRLRKILKIGRRYGYETNRDEKIWSR